MTAPTSSSTAVPPAAAAPPLPPPHEAEEAEEGKTDEDEKEENEEEDDCEHFEEEEGIAAPAAPAAPAAADAQMQHNVFSDHLPTGFLTGGVDALNADGNARLKQILASMRALSAAQRVYVDELSEDVEEAPTLTIGPFAAKPYKAQSVINISGMSFGALSQPAVQALSKGAALAGMDASDLQMVNKSSCFAIAGVDDAAALDAIGARDALLAAAPAPHPPRLPLTLTPWPRVPLRSGR